MGNFQCGSCGGDFYVPLASTFDCPNCHIMLPDITHELAESIASEGGQWGSLGEEPVEWITPAAPPNDLEQKVQATYAKAFQIWKDRQAKYGPSNIAATGALGCFVRANDKLARLSMVYIKGQGASVPDETVVDTWIDLINYATMGLMCHLGEWPSS